ncbi:MAG: hypothetical protein AB7S26_02495 [Sandaracinaceae bacterium]
MGNRSGRTRATLMRWLIRSSLGLTIGCASSAPPVRAPVIVEADSEAEAPVVRGSADVLDALNNESFAMPAWTPPLSGGTLLVTRDGTRAVAADPDRDLLFVVDVAELPPRVLGAVELRRQDEPGRLIEGADGAVYVALRRAGAVAKLDLRRLEVTDRYEACAAPRGLCEHDGGLHVACATGEVVTLAPDSGEILERRFVAPDLRDIGVDGEGLWFSTFREAGYRRSGDEPSHTIDPMTMPAPTVGPVADAETGAYRAHVAWRTFSDDAGITMVHQLHYADVLSTERLGGQPYYGGGAVKSAVTRFEDGRVIGPFVMEGALPLDGVAIGDGRVAIPLAGGDRIELVSAYTGARTSLQSLGGHHPVAVAYHPRVGLIAQLRDQPGLAVFSVANDASTVTLADLHFAPSSVSLGDQLFLRRPLGDRLFHQAQHLVACASCHPEGGDDGHVWLLEAQPRRTQSLMGALVSSRSALHWKGEQHGLEALLNDTWVRRMGGAALSSEDAQRLGQWIDGIPTVAGTSRRDPAAVARGRAIFESAGCESCHAGEHGTDRRLHDVGTGGSFMTPALDGIARRAPYLHDGCAQTLEDRFGRCHTPGHGDLSRLPPDAVQDLIAYVASR